MTSALDPGEKDFPVTRQWVREEATCSQQGNPDASDVMSGFTRIVIGDLKPEILRDLGNAAGREQLCRSRPLLPRKERIRVVIRTTCPDYMLSSICKLCPFYIERQTKKCAGCEMNWGSIEARSGIEVISLVQESSPSVPLLFAWRTGQRRWWCTKERTGCSTSQP